MPHSQLAFIDESGDPNLETRKQGVTDLFAIVAVIVEAEKVDDLRSAVNEVRKEHFGPGEMKSNGIGSDFARRRRILDDLRTLEFHFYALIVDKNRIYKDSGLQYKKSFVKHLNGKLHRAIFQAYPDLEITADEHGSREFMDSFENYIEKHHRPDLFYEADFEFVDSKSEVLVQLADILVGTMRKCAREDAGDEERELVSDLDDHLIGLDQWPLHHYSRHIIDEATPEEDRIVQEQSIRRAQTYIDEHAKQARAGSNEDLRVQCLRYLLFRARFDNVNEYVHSENIMSHLQKRTQVGLSDRQFRNRVLAKLRDEGVLIASTSSGYKLPNGLHDIRAWLDHQSRMIQPMLRRIEGCRNQIRLASKGDLDILDVPAYNFLRDIFD